MPGLASGDARVFVDREDVVRYVSSFRPSHATDVAGDEKRARNAITGIVKAGLLIGTGSEERFEISEAVEPLIPLELLQELLAALVAANDTEVPAGHADTADLFDDEAGADTAVRRRPRRGAVSMSIDEVEQTPVDGLFERSDVATPADDTMQWRAALLQMVNWGGFDGLTVVPLRGDATMISGASGVGKSTILDAYTALMMPSDTKFNGASNDAVAGRARGAGQRNLLSYLRGAVDVVDDPRTGRPVEKLLRGKGADTWGAIAMTFVNDQGGRFTVLRTYYVPRRATRSADVQMQLATQDGALPLDTLEVAVPERFHANTLKKLYPGIRVHRTYAEFAAVLHARLGIGANGDGAKALRLLARIQAGNQVRSVDELYKDMVLERPTTFAAADRAIEHFDDLDTAHSAMRTEEQKLELLAPITDLHDRRVAATRRLAELDSYGVTLDGDTPLRMWLLRTHLRLIESAVVDNRADRAAAADELGTTTSAERTYLGRPRGRQGVAPRGRRRRRSSPSRCRWSRSRSSARTGSGAGRSCRGGCCRSSTPPTPRRPTSRPRCCRASRSPCCRCTPSSGWPASSGSRSGSGASATRCSATSSRSASARPSCAASGRRWRVAPAGCLPGWTSCVRRSRRRAA